MSGQPEAQRVSPIASGQAGFPPQNGKLLTERGRYLENQRHPGVVFLIARLSGLVGNSMKTVVYGAPTRTRTADLLITNQLLYQLSYRGKPPDPDRLSRAGLFSRSLIVIVGSPCRYLFRPGMQVCAWWVCGWLGLVVGGMFPQIDPRLPVPDGAGARRG